MDTLKITPTEPTGFAAIVAEVENIGGKVVKTVGTEIHVLVDDATHLFAKLFGHPAVASVEKVTPVPEVPTPA